jgi:DNA invertase Pin-like site-specific DNA recombinase
MAGKEQNPDLNRKELMTHPQRLVRRMMIAEEVRRGMDLAQVAKEYKVSYATVFAACQEHGVKWEKPKKETVAHRSIAILSEILKNPDKSFTELAKDLGVSKQRVSGIYHEALKVEFPGLEKERGMECK